MQATTTPHSTGTEFGLDSCFQRGLALHQAGRFQEAEACYREVLGSDPEHADALHMSGMIALQAGNTESAIQMISASDRFAPGQPETLAHLGSAFKAGGRMDEALEALRLAVAIAPEYIDARFNLGNTLSQMGRHEEAEEAYRFLLSLAPDDGDAWGNLGCALRNMGKYEEAEAAQRRALELKPGDGQTLCNLAAVLCDIGRPAEAVPPLKEAVDRDSTNIAARTGLGNAMLAQGHYEAAIGWFVSSLRIDPAQSDTWNNLGISHQDLGDLRAAIECFGQATRLNSSDMEALNNLGIAFSKNAEPEKAIECFEHALRLHPEDAGVCNSYGFTLMKQGRLDEAIVRFREALGLLLNQERRTRLRRDRSRPMDNGCARQALSDMKRAFDAKGIEFFLCFGTLLGSVRQGDFLSGDKDIDVGVFSDVHQGEVMDALCRTDAFTPESRVCAERAVFSVGHPTGVTIDVFTHYRRGGGIETAVVNPGEWLWWRFSDFTLREASFIDETFRVPSDCERYLSEMYGPNWRVPDPHFDGLVGSPAIKDGCERVSLCYAYNRLIGAMFKGDYDKAAAYCRQILARRPDDATSQRCQRYVSTGAAD